MEGLYVFVIIAIGGLLWVMLGGKQKEQSKSVHVSPTSIHRNTRRRRRSGGFYPLGYDGTYLDGEMMVLESVWMAELAAMTLEELADLGEYVEIQNQEESPTETVSEVSETSEEPEEAPEATEFERIDPVPEIIVEEDTSGGGWGGGASVNSSWDSSDSDWDD